MTERERKILMGESIEPRTADENAYANASGGGGGGVTVATFTQEFGQPIVCDMTVSEIINAASHGPVFANLTGGTQNRWAMLQIGEESVSCTFFDSGYRADEIRVTSLIYSEDGVATEQKTIAFAA